MDATKVDIAPDSLNQVAPIAIDGLSAAQDAGDASTRINEPVRSWWWVLLILLLLNLALWFGFTRSFDVWGQSSDSAIQSNIAGEKINLQTANKTPQTLAITPAIAIKSNETLALNKGVSSIEPQLSCVVWSFNNKGEAARADNRLAEQAWSGFTTELVQEAPTYIAFVGPYTNTKQIETAIKAISVLKIKDYSVLPNSSISLGVVSTPDAAKQLQQQLSNRGLKGVQFAERQGKNKFNRYRFEKMSASSLAALRDLSKGLGTLADCVKP